MIYKQFDINYECMEGIQIGIIQWKYMYIYDLENIEDKFNIDCESILSIVFQKNRMIKFLRKTKMPDIDYERLYYLNKSMLDNPDPYISRICYQYRYIKTRGIFSKNYYIGSLCDRDLFDIGAVPLIVLNSTHYYDYFMLFKHCAMEARLNNIKSFKFRQLDYYLKDRKIPIEIIRYILTFNQH